MLKEDQLPHTTKAHAFKLMRRLAGASRQLPKSYHVGTFTRCKIEKKVIANGAFADIRRGRMNGKDIAIKTIRVSLEDEKNIGAIHEVREAICFTILEVDQETQNLGLLQGMCLVDEHVSPQRPSTYRSQNKA